MLAALAMSPIDSTLPELMRLNRCQFQASGNWLVDDNGKVGIPVRPGCPVVAGQRFIERHRTMLVLGRSCSFCLNLFYE